jgi:CDP-glycerol glycerophosphotransferase
MIKNIIYKIFTLFPIRRNKILLFGYYGTQYGCSPKYVSKYIVENQKEFDVVWATLHPSTFDVNGVRKVKYNSIKFFYELATTHFIITNYRLTTNIQKRNNQIYVQTWHSSLRLKKIEQDAEAFLPLNYIKQAKIDSKKIDYILSGCDFSTKIFNESFWYDGLVLKIGTPRIDPLIHFNQQEYINIKNTLNLDINEKILLYAPTFRKDNNYEYYINDFNFIIKSLEEKFGGQWKVIVRLHPHLMNKATEIVQNKDVIDVSKHEDIQELLMITDFLITDYSSLMFDLLFTKKPVLLYLPDLKNYLENERELYFNIENLPFIKAYNMKEINKGIHSLDLLKYIKDIDEFIIQIGSYEKGNASELLINELNKYI